MWTIVNLSSIWVNILVDSARSMPAFQRVEVCIIIIPAYLSMYICIYKYSDLTDSPLSIFHVGLSNITCIAMLLVFLFYLFIYLYIDPL